MKKLSTAILVMAASAGFAVAQTAATIPVGYITVDTPAESDSTFAPPLNRPSELSTIATAAVSTTLTVKATGVTASQFQYVAGVQPKTYYVKFTSGALTGQYVTITDNAAFNDNATPADTTDDTVDLTLETAVSITGTPSVVIAPYWSLGTLFPGGTGVGTTNDPGSPTSFLVVQDQVSVGTDRVPSKLYFYYDDGAEGPDNGWYDNDDVGLGKQDDLVIYPDDLYFIRNGAASALSTVVTGEVPSASVSTTIVSDNATNDNYIGVPYPVDMTLGTSGLIESGACLSTNDPGAPVDLVVFYDDVATGSNKLASKVYFHYDDGAAGPDNGWYDNDDIGAGIQDAVPLLKAGRAFVVRKGASAPGSVEWVSPLPYSLAP